jgi:hypothetical protein
MSLGNSWLVSDLVLSERDIEQLKRAWAEHPGEVKVIMTIGQDRVRLSFNPSSDPVVEEIKRLSADLIDLCDGQRPRVQVGDASGEEARLWSLAMTAYEEAAMWAVKAATAQK